MADFYEFSTLMVDGPRCSLCDAPEWRMVTQGSGDLGEAAIEHHECKPNPEKMLEWLLTRIGSWTNARWDQHLRHEFGDARTDALIRFLELRGVRPGRGL